MVASVVVVVVVGADYVHLGYLLHTVDGGARENLETPKYA